MKKIILFGLVLLIIGCKQLVPDKTEMVTSGKTTVEITVSLQLIEQLKQLCTDQLAPVIYPSAADRSSAISSCVFEHLSSIGTSTSALTDFVTQYCGHNANLTGLTPDQVASIASTCLALGK